MAGGGGCRDERRGSSASEVGTVDGTAKKKKKKKKNDAESKQHKRTQMSHVHQQFPVWTADEMTSSGLYRYYRHYVVVAAVPHMCYR